MVGQFEDRMETKWDEIGERVEEISTKAQQPLMPMILRQLRSPSVWGINKRNQSIFSMYFGGMLKRHITLNFYYYSFIYLFIWLGE